MSNLSPEILPPSPRRFLTRRQKAAVIVRLLINGGADPGIDKLPKDQQRQLVTDMASLRFIDRETLAECVSEFASELDGIGLHFPREIGKVLASLDGRLSLEVVDALLAETGAEFPGMGDEAWDGVANLPTEELVQMLSSETPEVSAITLSKLPPSKAAEVLGHLDDAASDAIAAAFGRTEDVTPQAVSRIGGALGRQLGGRAEQAFESDAVARVAAVMNAATSVVRNAVLDRLEQADPDFAARVRAAVFSFENIPDRLDPRDVPRVLRGVDNTAIVTVLAGVKEDMKPVCDFLLSAISKRLAEQMREDAESLGKVKSDDLDAAMSAIVGEIRRMEEEGELSLLVPDEEDEV